MVLTGKGVSDGIGIGTAMVLAPDVPDYAQVGPADAQAEHLRFDAAVEAFERQTQEMVRDLRLRAGDAQAQILLCQLLVLNDPALRAQVDERIDAGQCAEAAIDAACGMFIDLFSTSGDALLVQRAADLEDIRARMLSLLLGHTDNRLRELPPDTVLIAREITPSMTVELDHAHVAALVAETGGATSHAAILARAMGLPAVLGVDGVCSRVQSGDTVIVDGASGCVLPQPDAQTMTQYTRARDAWRTRRAQDAAYRTRPTTGADGAQYAVYANIGDPAQAAQAAAQGAEGVGLMRTEFLFLERGAMPTEDEQYAAYSAVAREMDGQPVIIRTLDVGGDKKIPYLDFPQEENPYLGKRAVRYCLDRPDVFLPQLRALLRAGAESGNIRIMVPMVTGVQEVRAVRAMLEQARRDLAARGVPYDAHTALGVMIETPAAALTADLLAQEADFFSIGTNDLVQYLLAADRGNAGVADLYTACHPAVLRSVRHIIDAARAANIPVGMCGEAAADERLVPLWMAFGLQEFSVAPGAVPAVRRVIARWTRAQADQLADAVMACADPAQVEALLAGCGEVSDR